MVRTSVLLGIIVAAAVIVSVDSEAAGQPTVSAGSWSFPAGSVGNEVEISVSGLPAQGLGTADVTVSFDPAVLEVTSCTTGVMLGACNAGAPAGPSRAAGFAAVAVTAEPVVVARVYFTCLTAASTPLSLTVNELGDGTVGDPQPIAHSVQNGTVVCQSPPTPTPTPAPTPTPGPTAPPTSPPPSTPAPTGSTTPTPAPGPTAPPTSPPPSTPAPTGSTTPTPAQSPPPAPTVTPTPQPSGPAAGDVDCDGGVNPVDALKILRYDAGLSVQQAAGCPPIGG